MSSFPPIKGLLIDLDGVLYVGATVIAQAVETIARIRHSGLPCRFITNTSTRSLASLHEKLQQLGFDIEPNEIVSAPQAAKLYLAQQPDPSCYLLLAEAVRQDFLCFPQSADQARYVVIGDIGDAWSYDLLNRVFKLLMSGAELIALHKNRFWQTEEGLQLDIGAFVTALEYASAKTATVIGKPAPAFFRMALQDMGIEASQAAIVGDDIDSDVGGGQAAGLTGILVKTGKYREAYAAASQIRPDRVLDSIADLPAALGLPA